MEIANVMVTVDPNHQIEKRDVTPAEAAILARMHFGGSNGKPLGDIVITGEAETVLSPGKPAQEGYFDQHRGRHIEPVEAVPAEVRPRTNQEEIDRLRKRYTGTIQVDGGANLPAFTAVFGSSSVIQLPKTFAEIADALGAVTIKDERKKAAAAAQKPQDDGGPTLEEYVAAGYDASTYPPTGYEAKDSPGWQAEQQRRAKAGDAEIENRKSKIENSDSPTEAQAPVEPEMAKAGKPAKAGGNRAQRNP